MATRFVRAQRLWTGDRLRTDALLSVGADGIRPVASAMVPHGMATGAPLLAATVLPPLTDAHVHAHLSDLTAAGVPSLARVLDLGAVPEQIATLATQAVACGGSTELRYAGAFLTAVGGYPSDRLWAPQGCWVELAGPADAPRVVADQVGCGASVVKIALNAVAGAVPDDPTLRALVDAAHASGVLTVAHAEGAGQAVRALAAGVDALAHTPWEPLDDAVIADMAATMRWVSTLDMHRRAGDEASFEVARDNLSRFAAAGGAAAYGTDLGNGLSRAGICSDELAALREAGLRGAQLLRSLSAPRLLPRWGRTVTVLPADIATVPDVIDALPKARAASAAAILNRADRESEESRR